MGENAGMATVGLVRGLEEDESPISSDVKLETFTTLGLNEGKGLVSVGGDGGRRVWGTKVES